MSNRIPILLYHRIDGSGSSVSTDPQIFRAHMKYLHERGWQSLSLLDFESYLVANEEVPDHHFMLCLDNAYGSLANKALPVMREFDYCGVAFIPPQKIGAGACDNAGHPGADDVYLSWSQIREMQSEGVVEFQPCVEDCQDFSERDASEIADDLLMSLELMSQELGLPHHYFNHLAWPADSPTERWNNIASDVGFDFQYTTLRASFRPQSPWEQIPRLCFDACPPGVFRQQFSLQTGPLSEPWHMARGMARTVRQLYRRVLTRPANAAYTQEKREKESAFPSVLQ